MVIESLIARGPKTTSMTSDRRKFAGKRTNHYKSSLILLFACRARGFDRLGRMSAHECIARDDSGPTRQSRACEEGPACQNDQYAWHPGGRYLGVQRGGSP